MSVHGIQQTTQHIQQSKSKQQQDNTACMLVTGAIARDLAAVRELEEAALKARRRHGQTEEIQEANQRT